METAKFESRAIEYLSGRLDVAGKTEFEEFLQENSEYQLLFESLRDTWQHLDNQIEALPSERMDRQFYDMLRNEVEKIEMSGEGPGFRFWSFLDNIRQPRLAYGMLLLILGFGLGYFLNISEKSAGVRPAIVNSPDTEEIRQRLVLTLLEQPMANQRLQGINEANKITEVDKKIIGALLYTLNNDPNANVRLAAIVSLANYADNALVREGLVASIVNQDSPIVQVTLADLMVKLQEKKSIEPLKTLMKTQELNESVKQKLETSIASII